MDDTTKRVLEKLEEYLDIVLARERAAVVGKQAVSCAVIPFPAQAPTRVVEPDVPAAEPAKLRVLQERLIEKIDQHYEELKDSIAQMGCRGDCFHCPHPDYPTVEEQVDACTREIMEAFKD